MLKHHYVYCLIDPTNGNQPFYVGKGVGRRAEDHLSGESEDENAISLRIKEIRAAGYKPYIRRFMWHLDETTAFAVETALINSFDGLVNKIQGQHLNNVRKKSDFSDWTQPYPGIDFALADDKPLKTLDAKNDEASFFFV